MFNNIRWIQHTHVFRDDEYECSSCKRLSKKPYRKCPYCNASIKGSKYEPSWVDEIEMMDAIFDE